MKDDCVFCDYAGPNEILWETPAVYVVEPLRQVTPGHVLVIPRAHATDFADSAAVTAAAFRGAAELVQSEELGDCNLITSKGGAASQTVFHVHIHVLPRTWHDGVILPWGNPNQPPVSDITNLLKAPTARLRERRDNLDDKLWEREGFNISKEERKATERELQAIEGEITNRSRSQARFRAERRIVS